jgi:hypothetical protein
VVRQAGLVKTRQGNQKPGTKKVTILINYEIRSIHVFLFGFTLPHRAIAYSTKHPVTPPMIIVPCKASKHILKKDTYPGEKIW